MISVPPYRWLDQPQLILWEQFDREQPDTGAVTTAAANQMFQNDPDTWMVQAAGASGVKARVGSVTNHVGVWSFTTGAANGNTIYYGYTQGGSFAGSVGFNTTGVIYHEKIVNISATTLIDQHFGLAGNWTTLGSQFVLFSHVASTGANWLIQTSTPGAVSTLTNTGITVTTGWHVLGIEHVFQAAEAWNFFLDGVLIGSITTNLPAGLLVPGAQITTRTAATRGFLVDDERLWVHGSLRLAN
jgi:hypothetical protein